MTVDLGKRFEFTGGAATFWGTQILAFFITVLTFGICYPFALVLMERWKARYSTIDGRPLVFTGSAWRLFVLWMKWLVLIFITLGIYAFWVIPRMYKWRWENLAFAD